MNRSILLLIVFTLFSSSEAVTIKNNTSREMFVIATYNDSRVRQGLSVLPGCKKHFGRVYVGRFDATDYIYPNKLYFYNGFSEIQCEDVHKGGIYNQDCSNYIYKMQLLPEDQDAVITMLCTKGLIVLSMRN